jgi:hypothetical protein
MLLYAISYLYFRNKYEYEGGLTEGGEIAINGNFAKVINYTGFPEQSQIDNLYYPLILVDKFIFGRQTLKINENGIATSLY